MQFSPALYLWSVNLIGIAIIAASILQLIWFPPDFLFGWLVLALLALASGATVLRLPYGASFSVGDAFSFAALFLCGIEAGTLTVVLDTLAISLRLKSSFTRTVFNIAAPFWRCGAQGASFSASAGSLCRSMRRYRHRARWDCRLGGDRVCRGQRAHRQCRCASRGARRRPSLAATFRSTVGESTRGWVFGRDDGVQCPPLWCGRLAGCRPDPGDSLPGVS